MFGDMDVKVKPHELSRRGITWGSVCRESRGKKLVTGTRLFMENFSLFVPPAGE